MKDAILTVAFVLCLILIVWCVISDDDDENRPGSHPCFVF